MNALSPLRASRLKAALAGGRIGSTLHCLGLATSTNDHAMTLALAGAPDGLLITADGQSAGRGRQGRPWKSPARRSLAFSVLLRPPPADVLLLTPALAVAITEALQGFGLSLQIKWPNDLIAVGRKVGGALVELSSDPAGHRFAVLGVGLNLDATPTGVPARALFPAGPLPEAPSGRLLREDLLIAICRATETWLQALDSEAGRAQIVARYLERDALRGRSIRAEGRAGTFAGRLLESHPKEGLRIACEDGQEVLIPAAEARILAIDGNSEDL